MPGRRSCPPATAGSGTGAHHPACRSPDVELLPFAAGNHTRVSPTPCGCHRIQTCRNRIRSRTRRRTPTSWSRNRSCPNRRMCRRFAGDRRRGRRWSWVCPQGRDRRRSGSMDPSCRRWSAWANDRPSHRPSRVTVRSRTMWSRWSPRSPVVRAWAREQCPMFPVRSATRRRVAEPCSPRTPRRPQLLRRRRRGVPRPPHR